MLLKLVFIFGIMGLITNPDETERKCVTCPVKFPVQTGKEWAVQCYDCHRDESTKRECKICKKKRIIVTEPSYKEVCGLCYKASPMKPCEGCREYNLKSFEWRSLCSECYKNKNFARPCTECETRPIPAHLPSYVTTCTKCYLEKKRATHDACPWCPPPLDPSRELLNKRKEAPGCRTCMKSKGLIETGNYGIVMVG